MTATVAPDDTYNGARATIREVRDLVDSSRREILAELGKLDARVAAQFDTHNVEHERERDWRASSIRWAVTTVVSAAGVLFAITWSLTR